MPIDNLETRFAKAGQAEASRRAAELRQKAKRSREIERDRLRHLEADGRAPGAAERVWDWLGEADARRLADLLRAFGLSEVLLLEWMTAEGKVLDGPAIGAWSVSLPAKRDALWVRRIAYPPGGRSRLVHSPTAMLNTAPSRIIVALDEALGSNGYVRTVRGSLRDPTMRAMR